MQIPSRNLVTVYYAHGQLEAEVVRGRLLSAGIPAILSYEALGRVFGLTMDGLGQVEVKVSVEQAEHAKRLLESPAEGDDSADEMPHGP